MISDGIWNTVALGRALIESDCREVDVDVGPRLLRPPGVERRMDLTLILSSSMRSFLSAIAVSISLIL